MQIHYLLLFFMNNGIHIHYALLFNSVMEFESITH